MGWLDGQVALVTGGGSGIGRAVVKRFIEEGARVGVLDRVAARSEQLRAEFGNMVVASGGTLYTASKHAVVGLIRQLAVEVGPRVRVNGVAPGGTITDLRGLAVLHQDDRSQFTDPGTEERLRGGNPLQLALQPADIAGTYAFLSSRTSARGITGTIVTVDAGAMLRRPRRTPQNQ